MPPRPGAWLKDVGGGILRFGGGIGKGGGCAKIGMAGSGKFRLC